MSGGDGGVAIAIRAHPGAKVQKASRGGFTSGIAAGLRRVDAQAQQGHWHRDTFWKVLCRRNPPPSTRGLELGGSSFGGATRPNLFFELETGRLRCHGRLAGLSLELLDQGGDRRLFAAARTVCRTISVGGCENEAMSSSRNRVSSWAGGSFSPRSRREQFLEVAGSVLAGQRGAKGVGAGRRQPFFEAGEIAVFSMCCLKDLGPAGS